MQTSESELTQTGMAQPRTVTCELDFSTAGRAVGLFTLVSLQTWEGRTVPHSVLVAAGSRGGRNFSAPLQCCGTTVMYIGHH